MQCKASNSLYNSALYEFRQRHYEQLERDNAYSTYWKDEEFKTSWDLRKVKATNYYEVDKILQGSENYKVMSAQSAQQTLKSVQEAINSFNSLINLFFKGEVDKPKIPRYRKSGGLNTVTFVRQALNLKNGCVYPSISKLSKADIIGEIKLEIPDFIDFNLVREIRIRPSRGEFWVDWICDDGKEEVASNSTLNYDEFLSIDHGVKFWLSAVTSKGRSFIVQASHLKTALFNYRDKASSYKKGKPDKYWDEYLDQLTAKRNLQIRDAVNKAARFIVNRCLKNGLGNLVIGWNEGSKQSINIGKKNNYEVVSMPTGRLIQRLSELCKEYGIVLHVITEEYTSKASFPDRDKLHNYGEKPVTWKPSGKRINRDQYRTKSGLILHADINAAANILRRLFNSYPRLSRTRKFKILAKLDGVLTAPKQYDIFTNMKKKYCKQTSRRTVSTSAVTSA